MLLCCIVCCLLKPCMRYCLFKLLCHVFVCCVCICMLCLLLHAVCIDFCAMCMHALKRCLQGQIYAFRDINKTPFFSVHPITGHNAHMSGMSCTARYLLLIMHCPLSVAYNAVLIICCLYSTAQAQRRTRARVSICSH